MSDFMEKLFGKSEMVRFLFENLKIDSFITSIFVKI